MSTASAITHAPPQGGLANAKMRKAAREEAERAAKQEVEDLHSMKSYNDMLKGLLSKEIAARENAEKKVAEMKTELEVFKTSELEALKAKHLDALHAQEGILHARFRAEHEKQVEGLVAERVSQARANDQAKYRDLNDIQTKLHIEFEDKYSQRFQKMDREKRELSERLTLAATKLDALFAEQKAYAASLAQKEALVVALEHRCESLEKLKTNLKSYRNIVKFFSCRVFINTVRLKRHLHNVYDSLHLLHEKLNFDMEYDRTSEIILPQHELEVWLQKTHGILSKNKVQQQQNLNLIFAGTSHPNTNLTTPHLRPTPVIAVATPLSPGGGSTSIGPASPLALTTTIASPTSANAAVAPLSPSSPKKRRGVSRSGSSTQRFFSGGTFNVNNLTSSASASSGGGLGGAGTVDPLTRTKTNGLGYTLNFREMLYAIAEVEVVLRGCLIECLNKAAEWKASSEDFFMRNQELVAEAVIAREAQVKAEKEIKSLTTSLGLLEKSLNHIQDERVAKREIDAQAPTKLAHQSRALNATVTRRLTEKTSSQASMDQNGLDRDLARSAGHTGTASGVSLLPTSPSSSSSTSTSRSKKLSSALAARDGGVSLESQTLSLLEAHERTSRLSNIDGTSSQALLELSARDLEEMCKSKSKMSGPKGFFDHHNALMKVAIQQKSQIGVLKSNNARLKTQLEAWKSRCADLRKREEFAWELGQNMDQEVEALAEQEAAERDQNGDASMIKKAAFPSAADGRARAEEEKSGLGAGIDIDAVEPATQQAYARKQRRAGAGGRPSPPFQPRQIVTSGLTAAGGGGGGRPQQLEVEEDGRGLIRATIPFSPPVFPVSPYAPARPHSSASVGRSTPSGMKTSMQSPAMMQQQQQQQQAPSGSHTSRPSSSSGLSPYDPPTRAQSASAGAVRTPSAGGQLLASVLMAQTQPISVSSQSYAGTSVYAPMLHLYSPSPAQQAHASNRAPERVYGQGLGDRPRTSGAGSTRGSGGGAGGSETTRDHFSQRSAITRVVNPLIQGGLASPSTIAAALVTTNSKLHPSTAVTGDVRYDIISPYVAAPLPWERKDPVRYTPRSLEPEEPVKSEMERRREKERKPRVPTQHRSRSKEGISPERTALLLQSGAAQPSSTSVPSSAPLSPRRPGSSHRPESGSSSKRRGSQSSFGTGQIPPPPEEVVGEPTKLTSYALAGKESLKRNQPDSNSSSRVGPPSEPTSRGNSRPSSSLLGGVNKKSVIAPPPPVDHTTPPPHRPLAPSPDGGSGVTTRSNTGLSGAGGIGGGPKKSEAMMTRAARVSLGKYEDIEDDAFDESPSTTTFNRTRQPEESEVHEEADVDEQYIEDDEYEIENSDLRQ